VTTSDSSGAGEVLDFWFGARSEEEFGKSRRQWFVKDPDFDAGIARRFGALVAAALHGGLDHWQANPQHELARIIVLDQLTRNIYRGTAAMFAGDALALAAAVAMVDGGRDQELLPVQRAFCYLPFEHSESLADQDRAVALFEALRDDQPAGGMLEWALRHREIIQRFGRFPHRNEMLGRASSGAEIEFLSQPGSRF